MMRDIEELDTQETAQWLGVTENAVKIRLHRARQALRALLESARAPSRPLGSLAFVCRRLRSCRRPSLA